MDLSQMISDLQHKLNRHPGLRYRVTAVAADDARNEGLAVSAHAHVVVFSPEPVSKLAQVIADVGPLPLSRYCGGQGQHRGLNWIAVDLTEMLSPEA